MKRKNVVDITGEDHPDGVPDLCEDSDDDPVQCGDGDDAHALVCAKEPLLPNSHL